MKSQVGSFGNNQNNRIEEAVGQAADFWMAAEHNLLPGMRPWFGYVMIVEDSPASRRKPKRAPNSLLAPDIEFDQASFLDRYQIAFERMVVERQLDAVCFAITSSGDANVRYRNEAQSFEHFATRIRHRCEEALSALGPLR